MTIFHALPWLILGLAVLVAVLVRGRGYHESADRVARECCRQNRLQLLDGTVTLYRFSFRPRMQCILRAYRFEYSHQGTDRHVGLITLIGHELFSLHIHPDHLKTPLID